MLVGQIADRQEVGDDPIHRKDAIGSDHPEPLAFGFFQPRFEIGHVVVLVAVSLGFAEAHAIDDGGVVQFIGDDGVFRAEQGFEKSAVGVEGRGIENRVFGAEKRAERTFEVLVDLLGAADEAHAGHAVAPVVERFVRSPDDLRMIGQAKIIVGAEIEHLAAGAGGQARLLRGGDDALGLESAGLADIRQLLLQMIAENGVGHRELPANSLLRLSSLYSGGDTG